MRAEDLVLQRLQESVDLTLLLPQALIRRCLGGFAVTWKSSYICFPILRGVGSDRSRVPFAIDKDEDSGGAAVS